jgi:hypothetical protein
LKTFSYNTRKSVFLPHPNPSEDATETGLSGFVSVASVSVASVSVVFTGWIGGCNVCDTYDCTLTSSQTNNQSIFHTGRNRDRTKDNPVTQRSSTYSPKTKITFQDLHYYYTQNYSFLLFCLLPTP